MSAPDDISETCFKCWKPLALKIVDIEKRADRTLYNFECENCGHLKTKIVKLCRGGEGDLK